VSHLVAALIYRWRFPLSAAIVLGTLLLAPRADLTNIDNDLTAWFSRDDPVFQEYERFREEFGGTRTLIVALEGEGLFTRGMLATLQEMTADIDRVPTVQRVLSLASANIVAALPPVGDDEEGIGTLVVRPLLEQAGGDPDRIRELALEDDLLRGHLVSADGRVTAIVISFDEERIDEVRAGVIEQIHRIVDPRLPPGVVAHYNGSLEISETYNRVTLANQRRFIPPILAIILVVVYGMFHSIRKTILAAVSIGMSVIWTLGLYSLLGFTFNVLASMIPPLVMVLAISADVHIMQHFDYYRRRQGPEAAFKSTIAHVFLPLAGASVTTSLGMLSLATSDVVAVKAFGIGAAIGIMVDLVVSIIFVPTVLVMLKPEWHRPPQEALFIGPMRRVAAFSSARPGLVLTGGGIVAAAAVLGLFRLHVDTNHINFFSERHPISVSARVIDRDLSGVYSFQVFLEAPPDTMKQPDVMQRMDRLAGELRQLEYVRKVVSVADYVKRVHQELHDGDPAAAVVPDDTDVIAQELFVFALTDEGRRELERLVSSDYSRAQMSIQLASMSSDLVFAQVQEADRRAAAAFAGTGVRHTITGSGRLFSTLDHYLVRSQLSSFGTAFVTVFSVIFLVFRSFRYGALAILPNLLPVLAVLGTMGWLGISLNVATVMLASVALGVVDDDTIHFINRFRRDTRAGYGPDQAIQHATIYEGRAALTTTIINACGFAVLALSEYRPSAWFGGLLALTMVVAFLAEVLILPATIKVLPRWFGQRAPAAAPGGVGADAL
jgi:uncharacterized protein